MIRVGSGNHIVRIAAMIAVMVYILQMLEMGAIVSVLFALSIVCVAASYLLKCIIRKRIKMIDLLMFALVALAIAKAGIQFNFDYYKPAIIVLCCVICIDLCPENKITEKDQRIITNLFICAALITNYLYYFAGLRYDTFGSTKYIALNMSNPNETGMWLTFLIVILWGASLTEQSKKKYMMAICGVSLIPILIATGSRTNLIAVFAFALALAMLLNKGRKLRTMPKWMIWIVSLSPALLFFFYMDILVPNVDFFQKIFGFFSAEGKTLTSRVKIWSIVQQDLRECFLLGKYGYYHTEQMHNSLATLYGRFGAFFTGIICVKFVSTLKKFDNGLIQWAMAAVWLIGCFEMGFFAGVAGMYMMILVLPALMKNHE